MAEAVVSGAFLRILEHFIGFADRLEGGFLVGAAAVAIGMTFHRDLAVRRLDHRRIGAAIDPEQGIIIGFSHGTSVPNPRSG